MSYRIIRFHQNIDNPPVTIKKGLSLEEAKEHCNDPETSSRTCTEFGMREAIEDTMKAMRKEKPN